MKKVKKKQGRPTTREAKYPVQAKKMEMAVTYLLNSGRIQTREALAKELGIDPKSLTNWTTGQIEISNLVKFTFSHLFQIQEEYWDAPEDAPVESYIGKPRADTSQAVPPPPPPPPVWRGGLVVNSEGATGYTLPPTPPPSSDGALLVRRTPQQSSQVVLDQLREIIQERTGRVESNETLIEIREHLRNQISIFYRMAKKQGLIAAAEAQRPAEGVEPLDKTTKN